MLVLHAAFAEGRLHLWGESTPAEGTPKRTRVATDYRYRASAAELRRRLAPAGLTLPTGPAKAGDRTIWLPAQGDQPLPSSPLVAEPPQSRKAPVLAPWAIPTLTLDAATAVELLAAVRDRAALAPGVAAGDDLRYWGEALRLAAALVYRQQVLPGVAERQNTLYACWTPVFLGEDGGRLERLAKSMPPVARALAPDRDAPPEAAPRDVLREFLNGIVDHLVRRAVALPLRSRGEPNSLHEQWLRALRAPDGVMAVSRAEARLLVGQIRDWQRPLLRLANAPYRLCFRLEEPTFEDEADEDGWTIPPADTAWRVHYLLQAREDPSLLVSAAAVWKPKRDTQAGMKTLGPKAREGLLLALGQAATLCPAIDASLKQAAPTGHDLDTEGAFRFLAEEAGLLEQNGFGVLLPAGWAGRRRVQLTARAQAKPRFESKAGMTLDRVLGVQWEIVLGETGLTPEELLALAKLKAPLVRVRGQWVQLSAAEIQAALALHQRQGEALTGRQLLRVALGAESAAGLPVSGVSAEGPLGELLNGLSQAEGLAPLPPPPGLTATLRPYQERGFAWLEFLTR